MMTLNDHWWKQDNKSLHNDLMATAKRLDESLNFDPQLTEWLKKLLNRNYGS